MMKVHVFFLNVRLLKKWSLTFLMSSFIVGPSLSQPGQSSNYAVADTVEASVGLEMEKVKKNKKFEYSGFIKYDLFIDTRQVVNAREGLVSMYPENRLYDTTGRDVNSGVNLNMLSIHSRFGLRVNGPVFIKAHTHGFIEADFYGNANKYFSDLNGLRLFNAYINFDWGETELLVGQYWHPMSIREFFPNTIAFSAGAPFHPMSRNPQLRVRKKLSVFQLTGALLTQRDFSSTGPDGPDSKYLRNSGIPNLHIQLQYNRDTSSVQGGVGIDYKRILPALYHINGAGEVYKSTRTISSVSYIGFFKLETKFVRMSMQGIYAQNGYDLLMLGGYTEQIIVNDDLHEQRVYRNLEVMSFWIDAQSEIIGFQIGAFVGYTKNLGSRMAIGDIFYSRGENIGWIYRISPRIAYKVGSINLALEGEYTVAGYGIANSDDYGGVTDVGSVSNFRTLLSLTYTF